MEQLDGSKASAPASAFLLAADFCLLFPFPPVIWTLFLPYFQQQVLAKLGGELGV
jgi:hypothetical protein